MTSGVVNAYSFTLPEWQAVKMIFFAPCTLNQELVKKWLKSRELSQISYGKDFQWGLWVLKVTYHFKAWAVNITILQFGFCNFFCWRPSWNKRNSKLQNLVAAASLRRLRECFLWIELAIYWCLTWKRTQQLQHFFGVWLFEKAWEISCWLMKAWDRSWNCETCNKVVRLGMSVVQI